MLEVRHDFRRRAIFVTQFDCGEDFSMLFDRRGG
jgi:hypothetical protein